MTFNAYPRSLTAKSVLFMALALFSTPFARTIGQVRNASTIQLSDSSRAFRILQALLTGVSRETPPIIERVNQPFYRATIWMGTSQGFHGPERAIVAVLEDSTLIPLGCELARRTLQNIAPPVLDSAQLPEYANWLAAVGGDVPPAGRVLRDLSEVPDVVATIARRSGVLSVRPRVATGANGTREITVFVWGNALFRIKAVLGQERADDRITEAELIVGNPPG